MPKNREGFSAVVALFHILQRRSALPGRRIHLCPVGLLLWNGIWSLLRRVLCARLLAAPDSDRRTGYHQFHAPVLGPPRARGIIRNRVASRRLPAP